MAADDNGDDAEGDAVTGCVTVEGGVGNGDDAAGGAMTGCARVGDDDEARGRMMPLAFDLAVAEEEGRGALGGCKAALEEVEAGRTILAKIFLAATRAASLSLLLQVEHVLRGDHSPCLSLS